MVVQSTGTNTASVTFHNVTPENNSVINSFILNKPSGANSVSYVSSSDPSTVAVSDGSGNLKINGFNGLKSANKNPNTIVINVSVSWSAAPPTCGSPATWTAVAYTGNFSSTTFQLVDASNNNLPINSVTEALNCYTLTGLPASVSAGTVKHANVSLTNNNGAGGASISASSLTITGSAGETATPAAFAAIAPGATAVIDVTFTTTCGASAGAWTATVTGFGGTSSASNYTVNACGFSFSQNPPANVGNGVPFTDPNTGQPPPVQIAATNGDGGALSWTGSVTFTVLGGTNDGTATGTGGVCVDSPTCSIWKFPNLAVSGTAGSNYTLKAVASVGTATSSPFLMWGGILNCGDLASNANVDPRNPITYALSADVGTWGLLRGPNKPPNPPACVPVPYTFTLNTSPQGPNNAQTASFVVPPGYNQQVAVEYVIVMKPVVVASLGAPDIAAGWTASRPNVSWGTPSTPVLGSLDYEPALSCGKDPADITLLNSSDMPGLLSAIPNAAPFNTLDPNVYPQYQPGQPAKVCIAQFGWTAVVDPITHQPHVPPLVQYWFKIIDEADGFTSFD